MAPDATETRFGYLEAEVERLRTKVDKMEAERDEAERRWLFRGVVALGGAVSLLASVVWANIGDIIK